MRTRSAEFTRREMIRLCHSALDARTLRVELLARLKTVVPFDYIYFTTTDPATNLGTSTVMTEKPPPWMMSVFLENEFLQDDFNKFGDMVTRHQPVRILSESTRHDLPRSRRYRDMLAPAEFLAQLAPHIADGLRKALLVEGDRRAAASDGPGVLLLAEDLTIVAATAAAEEGLADLAAMEHGDQRVLPIAVRSVVTRLRAIESGRAGAEAIPKVRVHTRPGRWWVVSASRLHSGGAPGQIAVMFETTKPAEIAPLIMQAYLLTEREGEITRSVLRGWSTAEIAANLHISSNTVQDHLKAIFRKVDVSSRGELTARIFAQQVAPSYKAYSSLDAPDS
ncbi:MAG: helix-turn-helix transcriptional regulator [Chloroflexi bacterium]|nr:helix-turn-helix transcriptional regulator [Chloroflexota bacterium]